MPRTFYAPSDLPVKIATNVVVAADGSVQFMPGCRFATHDADEILSRAVRYAVDERIPRCVVDGIHLVEPQPRGILWLSSADRLVLLDIAGDTLILSFTRGTGWATFSRTPLCTAMRILFRLKDCEHAS